MTHDQGFWTWPVDPAALQSRSSGWAVSALLAYALGTAALLLQTFYALPPRFAAIGVALMLVGIAGSVGVLGKVIVTRHRLVR